MSDAHERVNAGTTTAFGASFPFPLAPAEVGFSIAADVKFQSMTSCCHPVALWLMTPHEALASLRGRRQAAS